MPTFNRTGKEAVEKHHLDVTFHRLKDAPDLACGNPRRGNLWAERSGGNLHVFDGQNPRRTSPDFGSGSAMNPPATAALSKS